VESKISQDSEYFLADGAGNRDTAEKAKTRQDSRETNRGVGTDVRSDTSGVANLTVQLVLVDAVGGRILADMTGAAGEFESVGFAVLLRVEQVRAVVVLAYGLGLCGQRRG
jgi:hypothetical protein